ncbi:MAG: hypothetical protein ACK54X_15950 [Burkholderiales bacterium]|jgi:hypothetical protein
MNTRTLVSLPDDDKQWLDTEAAARGRPMTHLVQDAVAEYRVRSKSRRGETLDELLCATAGLFARRAVRAVDGATQQRGLRAEWGDATAPAARRARRDAS